MQEPFENFKLNIRHITIKIIYANLIKQDYKPPKVVLFWNKLIPETKYIDIKHWEEIFSLSKNTLTEIKVRSFQFKV